jgi:dTMP kinase
VTDFATPSDLTGAFIVVEGIDGSGSTTHSRLLSKALEKRGHEVLLTCEPTHGPIGGLIRQVLQKRLFVPDDAGPRAFSWSTMALLFAADRLDHLDSTIVPALREGRVVVSDRYDISSLAYQSATAPDEERALGWIRELNRLALRPDVTIVLNVDPAVASERRGARGGREELFEEHAIQERLSAIYARAERLVPGDRLVHIRAEGAVEQTGALVIEAVKSALPRLFPA